MHVSYEYFHEFCNHKSHIQKTNKKKTLNGLPIQSPIKNSIIVAMIADRSAAVAEKRQIQADHY